MPQPDFEPFELDQPNRQSGYPDPAFEPPTQATPQRPRFQPRREHGRQLPEFYEEDAEPKPLLGRFDTGVIALSASAVAIVLGIVVALLFPSFQDHGESETWQSIELKLPGAIADFQRAPDNQLPQGLPAQATAGDGNLFAHQAGLYLSKNGSERLAVIAARPQSALNAEQRKQAQDSFQAKADAAGMKVTAFSPAPYGGWFGCAQNDSGTMCLAVDAGAMININTNRVGQPGFTLARTARQAVERQAATS
jgi:hypothetical protein